MTEFRSQDLLRYMVTRMWDPPETERDFFSVFV